MFEISNRDGLARTGEFHTTHGIIKTPTLMPVINPVDIFISPTEMGRVFGTELVITNAYLILKHFGEDGAKRGVHGILDHQGPVMTDSGGFQILRYGDIEISPEQIIDYQDKIAPDIATILDIPTGASANREKAEETVRVTIERAKQAVKLRSNPKVMWCGPIQGGLFNDLVEVSAREMGKLDFQIHAVGSPVELMENYRYAELVDLTMTARMNLPLDRPVHLFGAGHPMMLALGVAMGCDLFDSAAYVLYARDGRYMTVQGTLKLGELTYFPCECPMCVSATPESVRRMRPFEQTEFLARHNLHVTFGEIRRIRQAILEGRFCEHLEMRCRSHPRLLDGLRRLLKYKDFAERFDPVTKHSAFFYLGPESAERPEVVRFNSRFESYSPPKLPVLAIIPFLGDNLPSPEDPEKTHVVKLVPPFGVVPEELDEVYPLWQFEVPKELDETQVETVTKSLARYLEKYGKKYERVILYNDERRWGKSLVEACARVKKKLEIVQP